MIRGDFIYSDINIGSISIVIQKEENDKFNYICSSRASDGFIFILDGDGVFESCKNKTKLHKNMVLILQRGEKYSIRALNNNFKYITTAFSIEPVGMFRKLGLPFSVELSEYSYVIQQSCKMLKIWNERPPMFVFKSKVILEQILIELYSIVFKAENVYFTAEDRLLPAIDYINRFYDRAVSVTELAELCNMSTSHFRRLFTEQFGRSPMQYKESIRIYWAKRLLSSNMFSVSEIADKLGYCDIYHFSKAFKKQIGISPSDYAR